jgi:hypothetical protein
MNIPNNPEQRHEWLTQERALKEERQGAGASDGDDSVAKYRLIARALRLPPVDPLPPDFASRIGEIARAQDDRFEMWLQRSLIVLLIGVGGVAMASLSDGWLAALTKRLSTLGHQPLNSPIDWIGTVAICLAFSFIANRWLQKKSR